MTWWWRLLVWFLSWRRGGFLFTVGLVGRKETITMLDIKLTNEQKIVVTATPVTATGKPAPLDGQVEFQVSAGDCTINRLDDLSVEIVSGDLPGDSVVTVMADADLGAGVETVADSINVRVEGAKATSLGLTVGTPTPK